MVGKSNLKGVIVQNGQLKPLAAKRFRLVPFQGIKQLFADWWNGGGSPLPPNMPDEWVEAYFAMRASLRRTWLIIGALIPIILLFGRLVNADAYWPIFLFVFIAGWFVLPRLLGEPAMFLWFAAISGWLILINTVVFFLDWPLLVRAFWVGIVILQVRDLVVMIKGYRQFRGFYHIVDTRTRKLIIPRSLRRGWAIGTVLSVLAVALIAATIFLKGDIANLTYELAGYLSGVALAFAVAALGVPSASKRRTLGGIAISVGVALGIYGLYIFGVFSQS